MAKVGVFNDNNNDEEIHLDKEILFDSISIHFSFGIFFRQFFIHMTSPFFIFLGNPTNQSFFSTYWFAFLISWIYPFVFYILIISSCLIYEKKFSNGGIVFTPLIFYSLHKVQVAIKYACLSKTEYDRFMSAPKKLAQVYQTQLQLLSGWKPWPEDVLNFEVSAAAMRTGCDVRHLYFSIANPSKSVDALVQMRNWKALVLNKAIVSDEEECHEFILQDDGSYKISVFKVAKAILNHSKMYNPFSSQTFYYTNYVVTLLNVITPLIFFYLSDERGIWAFVFYFCSAIITFVYAPIILTFMTLYLQDVSRGRESQRCMRRLIRTTDFEHDKALIRLNDKSMKEKDKHISSKEKRGISQFLSRKELHNHDDSDSNKLVNQMIEVGYIEIGEDEFRQHPRIDFDFGPNIVAWTYCRILLQNFGDRFRFRLDVFLSVMTASIVCMGIISLVGAFSIGKDFFLSPTFLQLVLGTFFGSVFLLVASFEGAQWNKELMSHKGEIAAKIQAISQRQIYLQQLRIDPKETKESKDNREMQLVTLEQKRRALEACLLTIEVNNTNKPFVILGIPASGSMTGTIFTALVTYFSTIFTAFRNATS